MRVNGCFCPICNRLVFKYIGDTSLNIQIKCWRCRKISDIHETYLENQSPIIFEPTSNFAV